MALGVVHVVVVDESVRSPSRRGCDIFSPSVACDVGHVPLSCKDEHAAALMSGSNIGRSKSNPFRIPPDFGKLLKNPYNGGGEPFRFGRHEKAVDVLDESPSSLTFKKHSLEVIP